jgi:tetratricopeptide (TPR) repeat protein
MDDASVVETAKVRAELDAVLRSASFDATERNRRFLKYVVEETLAGRGDRIKAYSIGTDVFGRGDDFDPLQDPIVRIEAGRLRRSLDHHYLSSGSGTGIRISIPKGSYVPAFEADVPAVSAEGRSKLHTSLPHVMVHKFEQQSWSEGGLDLGRTLTMQVISALTRFTELFVYGFGASQAQSGGEWRTTAPIDYELSGNLMVNRTAIHAEFLLRDSRDGRFVWSHAIERVIGNALDPTELVSVCAGIAGEVASIIAQRDGVMDEQAREMAGQMPAQFEAYHKLVEFQDYWRTIDLSRFEPLRRDLERVIFEDPGFAAAHACLSLLYSDAARYGISCGIDHPLPINRALLLARRAVELAPRSSRAHHALGLAEWFSGHPEKSLVTLRSALMLNPNDPDASAELGLRLAQRMESDEAMSLLRRAYACSPNRPGYFHIGRFFCHFANEEYVEALDAAMSITTTSLPYPAVACAAALSALGRTSEAIGHVRRIEAAWPGWISRLNEDLECRHIHPKLIGAIMVAIERLDVPGGAGRYIG